MTLEYMGYKGSAELDDEARVFHREALDTRDVITFEGTSVEELELPFREGKSLNQRITDRPERAS